MVKGRCVMNILLSSYSINPLHGSEDGIGWNWLVELSENFNGDKDRIWLVTKKFNERDTRAGIEKAGFRNVELVIVDVPSALNWFREKHSVFHHMYYILWQRVAYDWAKRSGIKFDIIHHVTMGDFRIPGRMYKFQDAYTIFGPVGGGQSTPKSLKGYERSRMEEKFREIVNKFCAVSPVYKSKIKKFDAVYAINKETAALISKAMGRRCDTLIEMALPENLRRLTIEKRESKPAKIIFVGRLIEKKGVMLLLDAVKKMSAHADFILEIYGDGNLREKAESFIEKNSLADRVTVCGSVPHAEISSVYRNADVFVMPSLRETSGNVALEAMAHKLPVVALDMSVCSEFKKHGCGLFVDIHQSREEIIEDFACKLETLVTSPELRNELGRNGYDYANSEFTWDNKFKAVYGKFVLPRNNVKKTETGRL